MPKTIVITGASSGMGRAAALRLAGRGERVVLAARRKDELEALARECGELALAVPCDVSDAQQVEDLAEHAVAQFGNVDAWLHTAAVASFGRFWETPPATMKRLVEVDLVGSMFVAREAIRRFARQEAGGTLVLVSSVLGKTPIPYLNVYNSAKHGVVGLATSIRADLKDAGLKNIHVVNVMPPSTDTPFYDHAANYVGNRPKAPPPAYGVDTVADALVAAIDDPSQEEVTVGAMGKLMRIAHGAAPGLYEALTGPYAKTMFTEEQVPISDGAVFAPLPGSGAALRSRGGAAAERGRGRDDASSAQTRGGPRTRS